MDLLNLIVTVVLVTASGVLAPGPLFFATITHGTKSGAKGGLAFAIAHTLIEFPLVILLAIGLLTIANEPLVKPITAVAGGLTLLIFGTLQIRDTLASKSGQPSSKGIASRNPLLLGLVFTGLNPYFITWWLTVGAKLILDSFAFASLSGVTIMFVSHIWMDYAWLTTIAHLAKIGTNIIGTKGYKILVLMFRAVLIYFGLTFLISTLLR